MQTVVVRVTALGAPLRGDDDATEGTLHLRSRCDAYGPRWSSEGDWKGSRRTRMRTTECRPPWFW